MSALEELWRLFVVSGYWGPVERVIYSEVQHVKSWLTKLDISQLLEDFKRYLGSREALGDRSFTDIRRQLDNIEVIELERELEEYRERICALVANLRCLILEELARHIENRYYALRTTAR